MSSPFDFNTINLSQRTKLIIVVVSIFLISLSVGMLVFGTNEVLGDNLTTDSLQHSSDVIQFLK